MALSRLPRWLGRNGGLLLVGVAVVATLFGTRQIELAVSGHKEALLRSQATVNQVRLGASDVRAQSEGLLYGASAIEYQFTTSTGLQSKLSNAAVQLRREWHNRLSRQIETQAASLNFAVSTMMAFVAAQRVSEAKAADAMSVGPVYAALTNLLSAADRRLSSENADANRLQSGATLAAAIGASLLLLMMMLLFVRARRRRDRAESEGKARRSAEERLRALVEQSSDVIVVVAPDSTILYAAGATAAVLGRELEQLHGTELTSLVDPDDVAELLTLCATADQQRAELSVHHADGRRLTCEIRAASLIEDPNWNGVVLHIWDVSNRKALELELRLAQKLEAVGQLAAGIAHEINTPIQYVGDTSRFLDNSFAELMPLFDVYAELLAAAHAGTITSELLQRVDEMEEITDVAYLRGRIPKACERTVEGVEKVSKIVAAMRAFAHPPSLDAAPADINGAIRNILTIATNEYKYVADVTTELGELPEVTCNIGDINQVVLNLIVNAAHAIADVVGDSGRRGAIRVRTWAKDSDVVISVADDGGGIPPSVAGRIFDPFFTTKPIGRGTGQGLALSRTIVVERHGGSLTFETRVGEGTTFFVRLPITPGDTGEQPARVAA
jgi:PAS domain S-box-containing protein